MSSPPRRGLQEDERKRKTELAALRRAFKQGEQSGAPVAASEVFDRLKAKYARKAARSKK